MSTIHAAGAETVTVAAVSGDLSLKGANIVALNVTAEIGENTNIDWFGKSDTTTINVGEDTSTLSLKAAKTITFDCQEINMFNNKEAVVAGRSQSASLILAHPGETKKYVSEMYQEAEAAGRSLNIESTGIKFNTGAPNNRLCRMVISYDGRVGIGNGYFTPNYPLHIQQKHFQSAGTDKYYGTSGMGSTTSWMDHMSAWFDGSTSAHAYYVRSDERIKTEFEDVSDNEALNIINLIEPKKYHYKDTKSRKPLKTIGFSAQQVKQHLSNAVSLQTGYVPDEMRAIENPQWSQDASGDYILTMPDLDLSNNHTGKVKFYVSNDPSGNDEVCKEVQVEDNGKSFVFDQSWNNVFFYGKEVNDFHTLDKNQIFALHHSAIQELSRRNDEKTDKIVELENKISNLESSNTMLTSTNETLKTRLDTLEEIVASLQNK